MRTLVAHKRSSLLASTYGITLFSSNNRLRDRVRKPIWLGASSLKPLKNTTIVSKHLLIKCPFRLKTKHSSKLLSITTTVILSISVRNVTSIAFSRPGGISPWRGVLYFRSIGTIALSFSLNSYRDIDIPSSSRISVLYPKKKGFRVA